jgi:hypothetical protein
MRKENHLEDQGVDGRRKLKWFLEKWDVRAWTGSMWLRAEIGGRLL